VPSDAYAAVVDFAQRHGFSLSPAAQEIVDAQRAAAACGVVDKIKKPKKRVPGVAQAGESLDDLRDHY
jgi:hypothetical protein